MASGIETALLLPNRIMHSANSRLIDGGCCHRGRSSAKLAGSDPLGLPVDNLFGGDTSPPELRNVSGLIAGTEDITQQ